MSEEPLAIGAGLLLSGIVLNMAHPTVVELTDISISGWGWLLILVGVTVIGVRLLAMTRQ